MMMNPPPAAAPSGENKQYLTVNQVLQRSRMNDPSQVRRMNVSGSALEDISVMEQFPYVEVCSFAVNDISDLEPLRACSRLQEVFLRKNRIADFAQILHLSHLPIRSIGLAENPISTHPEYRKFVISALPQLRKFDDVEVSPSERQEAERDFPDPFSSAMELGVAAVPAMAGRPSSTATMGTVGGQSPPRQQQGINPQQGSSPYDAFASTFSGSSLSDVMVKKTAETNNKRPTARKGFVDEENDHLAATSPSLGHLNRNNNNNNNDRNGNRYNGDDVPIGGGGGGMAMAPRPRTSGGAANQRTSSGPTSASSSSSTTTLAQKRAQMMRSTPMQQQQKNNFYDQEINVAVPSKNSSNNNKMMATASSSYENDENQRQQQQQQQNGGCNFSEDAAVQAVKVLLGSMTPSGLAQVKRYINAI